MTDTSSQWERLLRNAGVWEGSFARLSPEGKAVEEIPTVVSLDPIHGGQTMRQTIEYLSPVPQTKVLEYNSLNRSILFFEDGAFCQGSLQFSPFSDFGSEMGFIHQSEQPQENHRLRLVQLFKSENGESRLSSLTLIREHLRGTTPSQRPALTVAQLLGTWRGEAVTLYADWRSPDLYATTLSVQLEAGTPDQPARIAQRLTAPNFELASTATVQGSTLLFDQGAYPVQVLLLPDGASSNTPQVIPKRRPFVLEAGWLINDHLRQRLIRSYDAQGGWVSLTLITERKEA